MIMTNRTPTTSLFDFSDGPIIEEIQWLALLGPRYHLTTGHLTTDIGPQDKKPQMTFDHLEGNDIGPQVTFDHRRPI